MDKIILITTEISVPNSTFPNGTSTEAPVDDRPVNPPNHDFNYLFVPFSSLIIIAFLTITVIFLLKRKRRIDRLRHHLIPYYNFAPGEEDEWETELLESDGEIHARRDYNSVSSGAPGQERI